MKTITDDQTGVQACYDETGKLVLPDHIIRDEKIEDAISELKTSRDIPEFVKELDSLNCSDLFISRTLLSELGAEYLAEHITDEILEAEFTKEQQKEINGLSPFEIFDKFGYDDGKEIISENYSKEFLIDCFHIVYQTWKRNGGKF